MIHIYTGNGKGKTTAAVGLAVRCLGSGKKVEILQFLKDGTSCENISLSRLGIKVTPCQKTKTFFWDMDESQRKILKEETECGLLYFEKLLKSDCDMIILDEIFGTLENKLLDEQKLLELLREYKDRKEIVLTGRNASKKFVLIADYVSETESVKNPFEQGKKAKYGIEF